MIITTSWDDGHPFDNKLLELLVKYGIKGTFYIPLANAENEVMIRNQIQEISKFQEIGGHTVNHIYLNKLNKIQASKEITDCKIELEQIIGKGVDAFCFPGGKYSQRDIQLVKQAGFCFGRTTSFFDTGLENNNILMHTTVQVYNHRSIDLIKHGIKRMMIKEIFNSKAFIEYNRDFTHLSHFFLNKINSNVFHLWGHSWEIEQYNLWNQLEDLFRFMNQLKDIRYLTNTEVWNYFQDIKK